jgi:hypothetical protein
MKRLVAILFSVLLLGAQFAPAPAAALASPCCSMMSSDTCAKMCGQCDCCGVHSSTDSKSAPAVPAQSRAQNQISFLTFALVAWTLPENQAPSFSPAAAPVLTVATAPLFERDCARLL